MKVTVTQLRVLKEREVAQTPVIIGGGLVNSLVCAYVGAEYWAIDAAVGVELCKEIMAGPP
jgi:methanogenic corrinoid protein MtbC1